MPISHLLKQALHEPSEKRGPNLLVIFGMMAAGLCEDIRYPTDKTLILFTSDRRNEAEKLQTARPSDFALIHTTALGLGLENAETFEALPCDIAYLCWYMCALNLLQVNRPQKAVIIGTPENELSTLWNFELPLLRQLSPNCDVRMFGSRASLSAQDQEKLGKPYFDEYLSSNGTKGVLADKWKSETPKDWLPTEHQKIREIMLVGIQHLRRESLAL